MHSQYTRQQKARQRHRLPICRGTCLSDPNYSETNKLVYSEQARTNNPSTSTFSDALEQKKPGSFGKLDSV